MRHLGDWRDLVSWAGDSEHVQVAGTVGRQVPLANLRGWVVLSLLVILAAPNWDRNSQDDDIHFLPRRCDSVRAYHLLEKAFPQDVFASRLILAVERPADSLTEADLTLVGDIVADLEALRQAEPSLGLGRITSHRDPFLGKRLLSADGRCTLIAVALNSPYLALQTRTAVERAERVARQRLAASQAMPGRPDPPSLYATGPAGIGRDLIAATESSLNSTTLATIVLVLVILLLVYRAPLLALVTLATIGLSVVVALKLLALCTLIPGFHLMNISQIFAIVMLYGAGTDYCLFLISRYREELAQGYDHDLALVRGVKGVGSALVASAGTVICGLGLMCLAEFAKVRCGGPAIAVSLLVALAASLTLAPALLRLLGPKVFWPLGSPVPELNPRPTLWSRLSEQVLNRPALIWTASVLLLAPLALIGIKVKPSYKATGELTATSSSVAGLGAIQRHFNPGEIGPVTVLLQSSTDWNSPEGRALIKHLSLGFGFIEGVVEVRSLTQPLGTPLPESPSGPNFARGNSGPLHLPTSVMLNKMWQSVVQGFNDQISRTAREHYVAEVKAEDAPLFVTRLDVVFNTDPFDPRSLLPLEVLRVWLKERLPEEADKLGHFTAEAYGVTVNARDLAEITESDRSRINTLVLAAIFLILLGLVKKPWLAGYLLLTILFSYCATLGATTLLAHWFGGRVIGEVDWRVPFFLFTILVAVGEDYNILLVTRVLKEARHSGWREGLRHALTNTGGTITSCGLIMAGTFATLMLAGLNTLVQIGFALAFGVLLDTFVIRPFLVPAMMVMVWSYQDANQSQEPKRPRKKKVKPAPRLDDELIGFRRVG